MNIRSRFWNKVNLYHGITDEDCWEWTGSLSDKGYGRISFNGQNKQAHRIAYKLYCGPIESYLFVCHRCDNPRCVNPSHLFKGSAAANNFDCQEKGRAWTGVRPKGEQHGKAKLTDAQVVAIRLAIGTQREIAKQFNISQAVVSNVRNNKVWRHVC